MEIIYKIEIGAKCPSDNIPAKELIQSLSQNVTITLHSSHNFGRQTHFVVFDDCDKLHNKNRYALILSKNGLFYPTSNVCSVALDWSNTDCKTSGGHLEAQLSTDDIGYDHVLTDVRHNDRSLPVPAGCYSVCSSVSNGVSYADIYLTIHTKIV